MIKSVNIFGLIVPIEYVDDLLQIVGEDAHYDLCRKVIRIDSSLSEDLMNQRIKHEMGHAMWDRLGYVHDDTLCKFEEQLCDQFATMFSENGFKSS